MTDLDDAGRWATPTLDGTLVRLRPLVPEDLPGYVEMMNDPEGNDLTGTAETFTEEQLTGWLAGRAGAADRLDLAIVELTTGAFAGEVVLNEHEPDTETANLRISLRGPAWFGRGLGGEAVELAVAHAFGPLGLRRLVLEVLDRNPRARRVYERHGFVEVRRFDDDGELTVEMELAAPAG